MFQATVQNHQKRLFKISIKPKTVQIVISCYASVIRSFRRSKMPPSKIKFASELTLVQSYIIDETIKTKFSSVPLLRKHLKIFIAKNLRSCRNHTLAGKILTWSSKIIEKDLSLQALMHLKGIRQEFSVGRAMGRVRLEMA